MSNGTTRSNFSRGNLVSQVNFFSLMHLIKASWVNLIGTLLSSYGFQLAHPKACSLWHVIPSNVFNSLYCSSMIYANIFHVEAFVCDELFATTWSCGHYKNGWMSVAKYTQPLYLHINSIAHIPKTMFKSQAWIIVSWNIGHNY